MDRGGSRLPPNPTFASAFGDTATTGRPVVAVLPKAEAKEEAGGGGSSPGPSIRRGSNHRDQTFGKVWGEFGNAWSD